MLWCIDSASFISSINYSISSIKSRFESISRKVYKALVCIASWFGLWGAGLAIFWWHFVRWGKPECMKTLIS
jgi:hypothetical protein